MQISWLTIRTPIAAAVLVLAAATIAPAQTQPAVPATMPGSPPGGGGEPAAEKVKVTTAWRQGRVHPGDRTAVAVVLDIAPGWHVHADPVQVVPQLQPLPTILKVRVAPPEMLFETPRYPRARFVNVNFGSPESIALFEDRAIIYLPVKVSPAAAIGPMAATLELHFQACNDRTCLSPMTRTLPVHLEVVAADQSVGSANSEVFAGYETAAGAETGGSGGVTFDFFGHRFSIDPAHTGGLALLLVVAALGGVLLNVTPCVLPVIPLKIMSLSKAAGNRGRCLVLGLAMSVGVIAFWLALAGAILLTTHLAAAAGRSTGAIATNELFRHPAVTVGIGVVIAILAVGMCGLFSLRLPQWVYQITPRQETVAGSAGFGVMTAVLSTPCTAPLMGAAAAWAVQQSVAPALATFGAIGAGMALPYLILSAFPALAARMPRTGPLSELIKQVMGLFMLAAAAYFIGAGVSTLLTTPPDSPSLLYWWPVMALGAAAGIWLTWRGWRLARLTVTRAVLAALGLTIAAGAVYGGVRFTDEGPIRWTAYTPQRLQDAQAAGKTVVLDFTANWCLNCKALEEHVLKDPRIVAGLRQPGVAAFRVDLSAANQPGAKLLHRSGRSSMSIPWLVIIGPDGAVRLASEAYTVTQVDEALGPRTSLPGAPG